MCVCVYKYIYIGREEDEHRALGLVLADVLQQRHDEREVGGVGLAVQQRLLHPQAAPRVPVW